MPTILLTERYPIVRQSLREILSDGQADRRIIEAEPPDSDGLPSNVEDVDLAVLSAGGRESLLSTIDWIIRHFKPLAILAMVDANDPQLNLKALPTNVTCISNAVTPEVLKAHVNLLLVGGIYRLLRPYASTGTTPETQLSSAGRKLVDEPRSAAAIASPRSVAKGIDESEMLGLTPRQYQVLVLLSMGRPMKAIAEQMNISVATAKVHAESMYQRLNVKSRNAAVYEAVSRGATLGWTSDAIEKHAEQQGKLSQGLLHPNLFEP